LLHDPLRHFKRRYCQTFRNPIALNGTDHAMFLNSQKSPETPCPRANETIRMNRARKIRAEKGLRLESHETL
jgi:hypothetical protein